MTKRIALSTIIVCTWSLTLGASELPAPILDPYLRVQVALAADTIEGVKQEAAAIAKAAAGLGERAAKIGGAASKLELAADLKAARAAFGEVSDALTAYAEATGATPPPDVRMVVCPMAGHGWLQKGDEVRNPYYGADMLHCGEIKK